MYKDYDLALFMHTLGLEDKQLLQNLTLKASLQKGNNYMNKAQLLTGTEFVCFKNGK